VSDLDGKVALVTGAARGLGAAQVRALAAGGARVAAADVASTAELAAGLGDQGLALELDVTDEAAWQAAVAATEEAFGPISVLVNNAGIVYGGPIETLSEADYRKVIDVNQVGVFLGMKTVLPSMRRAGGGSIVNISSIGGIIAFSGIVSYVASKWAVRGMSKAAAQEFAADGVRVNSVHPGMISSGMMDDAVARAATASIPISHPGTPEDVAAMVAFLASDEAAYVTGSEFVVDGGYTAQ
jgi:3alpha(or 20beta)-hydroxysteroid dehydrogenase